jgi:hypothetical protein
MNERKTRSTGQSYCILREDAESFTEEGVMKAKKKMKEMIH